MDGHFFCPGHANMPMKRPCAPTVPKKSVSALKASTMPPVTPDFTWLKARGLPMLLLWIIACIVLNPALALEGGNDAADMFAGCCSVTNGIRAQQLLCVPFEIDMLGGCVELCSAPGF